MIVDSEEYEKSLLHYGILRRSGRYPWGSGGTIPQRSKSFLNYIEELEQKGMSQAQIAKGLGLKTTDIRAMQSIASNSVRAYNVSLATRLRGRGWSVNAIADRMGKSPSTVQSWLKPASDLRKKTLEATMEMLKEAVGDGRLIDVGRGTEIGLGVSETQLKTAVAALQMQGYVVRKIKEPQVAGGGKKTSILALAAPGTTWNDVRTRRSEIRTPTAYSEDYGETWLPLLAPPLSLSSKRVGIRYKEDGGEAADGVIYVRPGVKDLSLGGNHYAQVRILVDGTHYLKGMAVYKDDLPKGVDILFNTNKSRGKNPLDAMKPIETLTENPFGTLIKRQLRAKNPDGTDGDVTSVMNIVNESGDWAKWSKTLSSQMLSKQPLDVVRRQLDLAYEVKKAEFDEIMSLSNPTVRRKLLEEFSEGADAASVHLKAHALVGQRWQVILPVEDLPPTQVYAPNFKNGEKVILIRYPHGGKFEIPELVVNNRHRSAMQTLGTDLRDAIGIHPDVASQLSGADFDGDTVLVIPNKTGSLKAEKVIKELKEFNPRIAFRLPDDAPRPDKELMGKQMGFAANLISDMTVIGAPRDEVIRAVKHSMVVIDAHKHRLDYKESKRVHGIPDLMLKYQGKRSGGGATLVSRSGANARKDVPQFREARKDEGGPIDPVTGEKVYVPTGAFYFSPVTGKRIDKKTKVPRLSAVKDANELSSGTDVEKIYATHSNRLKALANQSRLAMIRTPRLERIPRAQIEYADVMDGLRAKLTLATQKRPLERQAQLLANAMLDAKYKEWPDLDKKQKKKLESVALETARLRLGSAKDRIQFTAREWEAIQAGAISDNMLKRLLDNSDMDHVRTLATPRSSVEMTSARTAQARQFLQNGYTMSEVAERLGVSVTTVERSVYGTKDEDPDEGS